MTEKTGPSGRLAGLSNISQWVQHKVENSPDLPVFAYVSTGSPERVLTWAEFGAAIDRAVCLVESYFDLTATSDGTPPVIGVFANLDSITYHALHLGILRAGGVAFLISTKNSAAAVAHLLKATGTQKLLVSTDEQVQTVVSAALASEDITIAVHTTPTYSTLFENKEHVFPKLGGLKVPIDAPAIILHSSGSTSFPKPIVLSHRTTFNWARLFEFANTDMSKHRFAAHAIPVYHAMGCITIFCALYSSVTVTVFPPQSPPIVPSPATYLVSAVASRSTIILCVPLFLEIWSHDAQAISHLREFKIVLFGGSGLSPTLGEELRQHGVPITSLYGATELGPASLILPRKPGDKEWDWQQLSRDYNVRFLPQEDPNTFELVYMEGRVHWPTVVNCTIDGKPAFATNDLVIRHPDDPLRFKLVGRLDDQIMLSSGEKTNPGPLEHIICKNPLVKSALMFGRGQDQNGIIIQPENGHEFDPKNASELSRFRNKIWESVVEANEFAPSHSRLFKEMILITYPSRPIEMTAKLSPRRGATLEAYKTEIDAAYKAIEESTELGIPIPQSWNYEETLGYVRKVVHNVMGKQVADEDDVFEHGGDSLQATYIRNTFLYALRRTRKSEAAKISQNFVYENASIFKLAKRLRNIVNAVPHSQEDDTALTLQEMEAMVSECSAHFPDHRPSDSQSISSDGEVILLTGTTGGLGSQLLAYLASSSDVSHVYALNRRSDGNTSKSLRERQAGALSQRGLDHTIIDSPKVTLVEGDTGIPDLDIDKSLYNEIRDSVTLIIHNAWKVHFNLGFGPFKPNVRGVRTLVDLALQSPKPNPPRFIFASSVGVFRNWNTEQSLPLEASLEDPKLVLGSGYSESKFVGERVLENAARSTPLRPIIVRIGQMTSTPNGAWNSSDWLPAIVRSGQVLGVLPARDDCIAWISLETAAQAIFEFRNSRSQYLHLAHPNPAPWNSVFNTFSVRLNAPLVSWTEWLAKLEKCDDSDAENNPALHLLEFFRKCAPTIVKNREGPGIPLMDMTQALKFSPTLARPSLPQTTGEDAGQWLRYWEAIGLLKGNHSGV